MNHAYPTGRKAFFDKQLSWTADTIKVVAVSSGYTQSDAHDFLDDVAGGAVRVATATLASKTTTGGVCDAADTTFTSVTGSTIVGLIVYMDTGTESTSPLIYWFDTNADSTPISKVPTGANITITWPSVGIFR